MGLTNGVHMHLGQNRRRSSKVFWMSFLMTFVDYFVVVMAAVSIYALLGHLSLITGGDVG